MTTIPTPQADQQAPPPAPDDKSAGRVLLLACGATFLAFFDTTVVNIAFSDLHRSFPDVTLARLTWVVTAYAVFFAALLASAGRLADVTGRRRLFVFSVAAFAATSALAAAAPNADTLVAARALQGAAAAGMIPAALGLLLAHTPPQKRHAAIGAWGAAGAMAAAIGPTLGGLLISAWDWRAIFVVNVPLGLLIAYATLRRVPADEPSGRQLPDPLGAVALVLGIGGVVAGCTQASDWGWTSGTVLGLLVGGAALTAAALGRSIRHPAPAVEWQLWRSGIFAASNVTSALFGAAMYAWLLTCPLFLVTVWHYSVLKSGLGVTPGAFTAVAGAVVVGRRVPASRQWVAALFGALCFGGAGLWMWAVEGSNATYAATWLPPGLLGGLGIGVTLTSLATIAADALPPTRFAAGNGLLLTARQVGGALGIAGLAAILASTGPLDRNGYLRAFLATGIVSVVASLSAIAMRRRAVVAPADVNS